ncbi:post-PEP-CTERM-1 domain-containing protein [Roseateles sp.]|uniref:post-PEP-CTERM-1 domain-containing protein n=1 Tax=Roseateles sp. TaxID=1971397 RepID=UPI003BAD075E
MSLKKFASRRPGLAVAIAAAALMAATSAHASKVVKDAQTGQLRAPNAEEIAAEQAAAAAKSAMSRTVAQPRGLLTGKVNPQPVTHANGMVSMELDESTLQYSTVTRNADGTLSFDCVTGKDAADAVVKGTKKAHAHVHAAKEQTYEK